MDQNLKASDEQNEINNNKDDDIKVTLSKKQLKKIAKAEAKSYLKQQKKQQKIQEKSLIRKRKLYQEVKLVKRINNGITYVSQMLITKQAENDIIELDDLQRSITSFKFSVSQFRKYTIFSNSQNINIILKLSNMTASDDPFGYFPEILGYKSELANDAVAEYCGFVKHGEPALFGIQMTRYYEFDEYRVGRFVNGELDGVGVLFQKVDPNAFTRERKNQLQIGNFEAGQLDGTGKLMTGDGELIQGYFSGLNCESVSLAQNNGTGFGFKVEFSKSYAVINRWKGQLMQGKLCGDGVKTLTEDSKKNSYEGQFRDNKLCGEGCIKFASGVIYAGQFAEDQLRRGQIITTEKKVVEGTFNLPYKFEGMMAQNEGNGEGVKMELDMKTFQVITKYEGTFKNYCLVRGRATYRSMGKDCFLEGEFENDCLKSGNGRLIDTSGNTLTGYFVGHQLNGQGKTVTKYGDVYEGNFIDNKLNGQCTILNCGKEPISGFMRFPFLFKGELVNNNGCGQGVKIQVNNDYEYQQSWEGEFIDYELFGQGLLKMLDGDMYKGTFEHDKINGIGKMKNRYGQVSHLEFKDGMIIRSLREAEIQQDKGF